MSGAFFLSSVFWNIETHRTQLGAVGKFCRCAGASPDVFTWLRIKSALECGLYLFFVTFGHRRRYMIWYNSDIVVLRVRSSQIIFWLFFVRQGQVAEARSQYADGDRRRQRRQWDDADEGVTSRGQKLRPLKINEEVLARWSDDGWYYRGESLRQWICCCFGCNQGAGRRAKCPPSSYFSCSLLNDCLIHFCRLETCFRDWNH